VGEATDSSTEVGDGAANSAGSTGLTSSTRYPWAGARPAVGAGMARHRMRGRRWDWERGRDGEADATIDLGGHSDTCKW